MSCVKIYCSFGVNFDEVTGFAEDRPVPLVQLIRSNCQAVLGLKIYKRQKKKETINIQEIVRVLT